MVAKSLDSPLVISKSLAWALMKATHGGEHGGGAMGEAMGGQGGEGGQGGYDPGNPGGGEPKGGNPP